MVIIRVKIRVELCLGLSLGNEIGSARVQNVRKEHTELFTLGLELRI